jgi:arylsulfatase A-like enzyme
MVAMRPGGVDGQTTGYRLAVAPNVLLVVMDTARADGFEPYGAVAGSTPAVAELARRGMAAPRVHATANWTLPSHASLFSGRLPRALGIGGGATLAQVLTANQHLLLAPVLRDEGWHTIAITANPFVSPGHGFGLGIDRFFEVRSARRPLKDAGSARARWLLDGALADVDDGLTAVEDTFDRAVAEAPGDRPWFAFVNLMECHSPYLPPRPWNDLGPLERLRAVEDVRRYQSHSADVGAATGGTVVPPASLHRMRHLYGTAISMMDAWVGRVVERLSDRGRLDDTVVIVTSDHGENLGEEGRLGHTLSVDERLLRVPMVAAGGGVDLDGVVSIADVPRVIAEAVGLSRHPWSRPASPEGFAVAQNDGYRAVHPAFGEMFQREWNLSEEAVAQLDQPMRAAIDARFKLVRTGSMQRLHDLAEDPLERLDVAGQHPDELARLAAVLDHTDADVGAVSAQTSPTSSSAPSGAEDLVDRLRLLGYV